MTERLGDDLDTLAEPHGYSGRNEVIRDSCQSLLEAYRETEHEGKRVLATVTAVFGYDNPTVEGQTVDIPREFEASIRSNSYNCLEDNAGCVETFVLETEYSDFIRFIGLIRGAGESVSVEYTGVPVDTMQPESGEPHRSVSTRPATPVNSTLTGIGAVRCRSGSPCRSPFGGGFLFYVWVPAVWSHASSITALWPPQAAARAEERRPLTATPRFRR